MPEDAGSFVSIHPAQRTEHAIVHPIYETAVISLTKAMDGAANQFMQVKLSPQGVQFRANAIIQKGLAYAQCSAESGDDAPQSCHFDLGRSIPDQINAAARATRRRWQNASW